MADERTHIVALSGGKDSTAMALALKEFEPHRDYLFVCTPTGDELPEMKAHWEKLEALLGQPIISLTDRTLESEVDGYQMIPNHRARWCTRRLKIEPFKEFLDNRKPAVSYVGLRADELGREGGSYGGEVNVLTNGEQVPEVDHRFPLQEWGWGLDEVWDYLDRRGIEIPWRTDCARCFFQRIGEWFILWRDYHEQWLDAEAQELRIGHTYRGPKLKPVCPECAGEGLEKVEAKPGKQAVYRCGCGFEGAATKSPVYEDRYGIGEYNVAARDTWPAWLCDLRRAFEAGYKPKEAQDMDQGDMFGRSESGCRVCTM